MATHSEDTATRPIVPPGAVDPIGGPVVIKPDHQKPDTEPIRSPAPMPDPGNNNAIPRMG